MTKGDDVAAEVIALVRADVATGFDGMLSSRHDAPFAVGLHDSDLNEAGPFATSDDLVVVPWLYPCTHTGTFLDIPATSVDLELRGSTFVDIREDNPDDWIYYRYIDFIGALHQIGVPTDGRPVIATPE